MKVVLDEQHEDDSRIEVDEISFVFYNKDKLYIHKSTIDFDPFHPEAGLVVTPWFNGF